MSEAANHEDTTRAISDVNPESDHPSADDKPQSAWGTPPADPQAQADGSDSDGAETFAEPADPEGGWGTTEDPVAQGESDTDPLPDSPAPEIVAETAEADQQAEPPQVEEPKQPVQPEPADEPEEVETVEDPPSNIERDVAELGVLLTDSRQRLEQLEKAVLAVDEKVSLIPTHVRSLGAKVEGLTTSVSEPRYRAVMMDLLRIYDMVDQMCNDQSAAQCDVLRTQIHQVLEMNGLTKIPAEGEFDPELHRAVSRVPCDDETLAGQIKSVARAGFRTEQSILRYSEVDVWHYEAGQEAPVQEAQQQQEPPSPETEQPQVEPDKEAGAAEEIGDATDESQVT